MGGLLMVYLPLTHLPAATVSAAVWALSRPDADANATRLYCGWIAHPETNQHALTLDPEDTQPIHPNADLPIAQIVGALRPLVGDVEADALQAHLTQAKGGRVNVVDMLPPTLSQNLLTAEQATAAGWFEQSEQT